MIDHQDRDRDCQSAMNTASRFRTLLETPGILTAPGVYDALGALIARDTGFQALYLSGASIAYSRLGRADVGLVTLPEVAEVLGGVRERVDLPVIVDADTGFGNALNVQRSVRLLERRGAAAIQIEDQSFPKRCGHLAGKQLIPTAEMVGEGLADAGVLICGSGIGMSIAANKVLGVRASLVFTAAQATTTRQHNDSNVLCLSGDGVDPATAVDLTRAWLSSSFEGGRHARRVDKIIAWEQAHQKQE